MKESKQTSYWQPSKAANQCVICNSCIDLHMSNKHTSERITFLRSHCVCVCVCLREQERIHGVLLFIFLRFQLSLTIKHLLRKTGSDGESEGRK